MLGNALLEMGREDEAKWYWQQSEMLADGHDVLKLDAATRG